MDTRQSIIYGQASQTLELYPPQAWGAGIPSAATAKVWRGGQANAQTPEFEPVVSIDSTNLALDAAAGYGQANQTGGRRRVPLASTAGLVVARIYLLEENHRELIRPRQIVTNDYVDIDVDLANDYTTAARVKGIRMTAPVDDTFAATLSKLNTPELPYRVEWRYTIGGLAVRHMTYFDLVTVARQHGVTVQDIYRIHADLQHVVPAGRAGGLYWQDKIDRADELVRRDYRKHKIDPNEVAEGETHDNNVVLRAILEGAKDGKVPTGRDRELFIRDANRDYWDAFNDSVTGPKLLLSQNRNGAITEDPVLDTWCKS